MPYTHSRLRLPLALPLPHQLSLSLSLGPFRPIRHKLQANMHEWATRMPLKAFRQKFPVHMESRLDCNADPLWLFTSHFLETNLPPPQHTYRHTSKDSVCKSFSIYFGCLWPFQLTLRLLFYILEWFGIRNWFRKAIQMQAHTHTAQTHTHRHIHSYRSLSHTQVNIAVVRVIHLLWLR